MRGSNISCPPRQFSEWRDLENAEWKPSYPFNDKNVRTHVINSLHKNQRGLCVYCGQSLNMSSPGKTFHIEHFRPQDKYGFLDICYYNLFLSCGQEDRNGNKSTTCGTHKANWFDEKRYIYPAYPFATRRFNYLRDGRIDPKNPIDQAAKEMIEILNLNHPELKRERSEILSYLDNDELELSDFWNEHTKMAESLAHVAFEHFEKNMP